MGGLGGVHSVMEVLLLLLGLYLPQPNAFVVITARDTPIDSLTRFQLKQVYLGKLDKYKGTRLHPLQLRKDHPLRDQFDTAILGSQEDRSDYRLKQRLQGPSRQPLTVGDWALMLAYVKRNPGYIGYIPLAHAEDIRDAGVKIVRLD